MFLQPHLNFTLASRFSCPTISSHAFTAPTASACRFEECPYTTASCFAGLVGRCVATIGSHDFHTLGAFAGCGRRLLAGIAFRCQAVEQVNFKLFAVAKAPQCTRLGRSQDAGAWISVLNSQLPNPKRDNKQLQRSPIPPNLVHCSLQGRRANKTSCHHKTQEMELTPLWPKPFISNPNS